MYCLRCIAISIVLLATTGRAADRPNILYIMSDDHAAHAISAYKGRLAEIAPTPNLDRIAHEGALFSNAFCTNSICSPSRACVITGQYNHTNGVFDLGGRIPPGKQMLPLNCTVPKRLLKDGEKQSMHLVAGPVAYTAKGGREGTAADPV